MKILNKRSRAVISMLVIFLVIFSMAFTVSASGVPVVGTEYDVATGSGVPVVGAEYD